MKKWSWLAVVIVGVMLLFSGVAVAKVSGVCSNCHTMHNSQGGSPMAYDESGNPLSEPQGALLITTCLGCHSTTGTDVTKTVAGSTVPLVYSSGGPTYTTDGKHAGMGEVLAGGNFYWATDAGGGDAKGHNVSGIGTTSFTQPPGYSQATSYGRPATWTMSKFTCAGTYGCHGDPTKEGSFAGVYGAHHTNDECLKLATYNDSEAGKTVGTSYRFLLGIKGIEDDDWELSVSPSEHNVYLGEDRTSDAISSKATISYLCAECHGDFHSGTGNLGMDEGTSVGHPWLRHPTDWDMGNTDSGSEYRSYGHPNQAVGTYSPIAPVGWATLTANMTINQVNFSDDTIVLCVSCHRAHGTPNDDILRWDYSAMNAGSDSDPRNNIGGCFICHTTK